MEEKKFIGGYFQSETEDARVLCREHTVNLRCNEVQRCVNCKDTHRGVTFLEIPSYSSKEVGVSDGRGTTERVSPEK